MDYTIIKTAAKKHISGIMFIQILRDAAWPKRRLSLYICYLFSMFPHYDKGAPWGLGAPDDIRVVSEKFT